MSALATVSQPSMKDVVREIAELYDLSVEELRGCRRDRQASWPRQEAYWRLSQMTKADSSKRYTPGQIAFYFNRDRTCILWGIKRHEERLGKRDAAIIKSVLSLPQRTIS